MANKILSFEEYVRESDRAEDIENDITALGEPEDLEDEVEETPEEVEVAEEDEVEEEEHSEEDEVEEDEDSEEEAEESIQPEEEAKKIVSEMLSEVYNESCKNEAVAYDNDDYEEHTVESYMKENAALVAGLAAKVAEDAYAEVTETECERETYESLCESIKESFVKKIDEMKAAFDAEAAPSETEA